MTDATPTITLADAPPSAADADLLAAVAFEKEDATELRPIDAATGGELGRALAAREFRGKLYDLFFAGVTDGAWRPRRVLLVGAGPREGWSVDRARRLAATVGLAARARRIERIAVLLPPAAAAPAVAQAMAEGLVLSTFDNDRYKTCERDGVRLTSATIVGDGRCDPALQRAVERGIVLGVSSNLARDLSNEPANLLTPRVFAERAASIAAETGCQVDVLDERQIADLRMGLLLGVARGSAEPPRLIRLRYEPDGGADCPVLGLVGKGITFDTGGISIKPADGMDRMKDDMAGGAAVVCAMRAIARLKPPIRVIGVVPTTENMPGGRAVKPGDVLTSASGKTVEVLNTDAEGRLILADALWYARQLGATHVVDIATLTGACVVALGKITSGLFGTPQPWVDVIRRVAESAGDRCWQMPLFDDYAEQLRSEIADMINSPGRPAGAITAAMFLKEFSGSGPWAHMDIAGTAWSDEARPFQPKGASGVGVRTLAELPFTAGEWRW